METSVTRAAAFLQVEPNDPVGLLAKLEQQIGEWEALARNDGGRVNRLRLASAKRALETVAPWVPVVRLFAEIATLATFSPEERKGGVARLRREKVAALVQSLPEGDEKRLLAIGLEELDRPPTVSLLEPIQDSKAPLSEVLVEVSAPVPLTNPEASLPRPIEAARFVFTTASEHVANEGEVLRLPILTEPPALAFAVSGLPSFLSYSPQGHVISGRCDVAGVYRLQIHAFAPGTHGESELTLIVKPTVAAPSQEVPSFPPSRTADLPRSEAPTKELPPPQSATHAFAGPDRFSVSAPNGTRLHIFATQSIRLGRNDESDCPVVAIVKKDPAATKALNGEISRRHAELFWRQGALWVRDGWDEAAIKSKFGTFLDRYEVPVSGVPLRDGQMLRLTQRSDGCAPTWCVRFLPALHALPAVTASQAGAVFLERLDSVGDHLLLVHCSVNLASTHLGIPPIDLVQTTGGLAVLDREGARREVMLAFVSCPSLVLGKLGKVSPLSLHEAIHRAFKGP